MPKQHEQQAAEDDVPVELVLGVAAGEPLLERERHRDAGHEQEQREDQVVEREAVPLGMLQLAGRARRARPSR